MVALIVELRMVGYLRVTVLVVMVVVILSAIGLNIALFVKTFPI